MKTAHLMVSACALSLIVVAMNLFGDDLQPRPRGDKQNVEKRKNSGNTLPMPTPMWASASLLVARPTDSTVDINVLPYHDIPCRVCYRKKGETAIHQGLPTEMKSGFPSVLHIKNLEVDSAYDYWLDCGTMERSPEYTFRTQRKPGSTFQFIVQGDSHPERSHQLTPALYEQALKRAAREKPDFLIALGDDFSVDTLREITPAAVDRLYRLQREYLGFVGANAPLFFVNGNHEQAARCNLDGTPDNVAVWAQNRRETYFSQPAPFGIYSGDREEVKYIGLLRDYYAWEWADALFVVIDPYWHSRLAVDNTLGKREKIDDEWNSTLGDAQYAWLKQTLASSQARFKFVFTHHVLGRGRGGVECASRGEWGGEDRRGGRSFSQMRPGWEMPIHQLLVKNHVTILFQGHDHLFCKQELDGVIYQTCPLPAGLPDSLENGEAYRSGTALPGSGFLRVTVQPNDVRVEFVKNLLSKDTAFGKDGDSVFSYTLHKK